MFEGSALRLTPPVSRVAVWDVDDSCWVSESAIIMGLIPVGLKNLGGNLVVNEDPQRKCRIR